MHSFRTSATILAGVIGSFIGVANASQLIVFDQPIISRNQEVSADFAANRELGRAWIEIQLIIPPLGEEAPAHQTIPKAVEGLYYDSARKQVLYRAGNETLVCAEDAKFLWKTYLKSTGQCLLTSRIEQRKVDTGNGIRVQSVAKVVFEPLTSNASRPAAS